MEMAGAFDLCLCSLDDELEPLIASCAEYHHFSNILRRYEGLP